jgi:hypothetical protein
MLDMEKLAGLVGKQANDPAVQQFLSLAQLPARPKLPRSDPSVYLNKESDGFSTLFEEADYAAQEHGLTIEGDAPVLTAIFLYGPDDDEFSPFQGALISGMSFSMGRAEIGKRMGQSVLFDEEFNTEAWDIAGGVRVFVDYDDERKRVKLIQIGLTPAA